MEASEFRRVMGQFATGVAIVTTGGEDGPYGFTVNSLTAVSLDPLLVLVCVANGGQAHRRMTSADRFGINILSADQQELSARFASAATSGCDRLDGVAHRAGIGGVPLIAGTLAHLECEVTDRFEAGDHTIVLGRVERGEVTAPEKAPLLYFRGRYCTTSEPS